MIVGHMQWLYDLEGNMYNDMIAGIIATVIAGHAHPKVQEVCLDPVVFSTLLAFGFTPTPSAAVPKIESNIKCRKINLI